ARFLLHSCLSHPVSSALSTLSLHDALPISCGCRTCWRGCGDRARARRRARRAGDAHACTHGAPRARGVAGAVGAVAVAPAPATRSEEHTSELQSRVELVCRLRLEKQKPRLT